MILLSLGDWVCKGPATLVAKVLFDFILYDFPFPNSCVIPLSHIISRATRACKACIIAVPSGS